MGTKDFQAPNRTKSTIKASWIWSVQLVCYIPSLQRFCLQKNISKYTKKSLFTEYLALTFVVSIDFHCLERVTVDAPLASFGKRAFYGWNVNYFHANLKYTMYFCTVLHIKWHWPQFCDDSSCLSRSTTTANHISLLVSDSRIISKWEFMKLVFAVLFYLTHI